MAVFAMSFGVSLCAGVKKQSPLLELSSIPTDCFASHLQAPHFLAMMWIFFTLQTGCLSPVIAKRYFPAICFHQDDNKG